MRGYIQITNKRAFDYHKSKKDSDWVFCRKSARRIYLKLNDYVFFLCKGRPPRPIVGYAQVNKTFLIKVSDIWNKYREKTSRQDIEDLEIGLGKKRDELVFGYELTNTKYIDLKNKLITDVDIGFAKCIVSGKFISNEKTHALLSYFSTGKKDGIEKYFRKI